MVRLTYQFKGMADFQVLPPGLNQVPYKAEALDLSIFQIQWYESSRFPTAKVTGTQVPAAVDRGDSCSEVSQIRSAEVQPTSNKTRGCQEGLLALVSYYFTNVRGRFVGETGLRPRSTPDSNGTSALTIAIPRENSRCQHSRVPGEANSGKASSK
ncbi:hypothetical protein GBAR_LOCUS8209 [Geodia barretti]|uniref:Uncharacterized protein n=1 Tax=Geodia barretti TaxID=519541 RepID=A0AA35WD52_GEOBA|nr:hypothetical protein GBAR_LOCUS8209 [Geodia barretti]